jgi:hypothetical protein
MAAKSETIHQLKITLDDITPPIWRRVQMQGNFSFADMHRVIQIVMGWDNSHMHQFIVGEVNYGDASFDGEVEDESAVTLSQIIPEEHSKFRYEYDFGDNWTHTIVVEKIVSVEPGTQYPHCLAGKRAGPPEDIGGRYGYAHFLEVLSDPEDENYERMKVRAGEDFDSEKFDPEEANNKLHARKARVEWFPDLEAVMHF